MFTYIHHFVKRYIEMVSLNFVVAVRVVSLDIIYFISHQVLTKV